MASQRQKNGPPTEDEPKKKNRAHTTQNLKANTQKIYLCLQLSSSISKYIFQSAETAAKKWKAPAPRMGNIKSSSSCSFVDAVPWCSPRPFCLLLRQKKQQEKKGQNGDTSLAADNSESISNSSSKGALLGLNKWIRDPKLLPRQSDLLSGATKRPSTSSTPLKTSSLKISSFSLAPCLKLLPRVAASQRAPVLQLAADLLRRLRSLRPAHLQLKIFTAPAHARQNKRPNKQIPKSIWPRQWRAPCKPKDFAENKGPRVSVEWQFHWLTQTLHQVPTLFGT